MAGLADRPWQRFAAAKAWRAWHGLATLGGMSNDKDYVPPHRDEDAVTYLPIDKQKEARIPFGPTDLRGSSATGGIRVGQKFPFVADDSMPALEAERIGKACDNIVRGHEAWASILYLSRAQVRDIPQILEASQSYEIKMRWERLWVLSPFLNRLARHDEAKEPLTKAFAEDVAGLHLLSKFAEQNNPSVTKLFARLKPTLVGALLANLCEHAAQPRKAALLCSILASLETNETALEQAMPKSATVAQRKAAMELLYRKPDKKTPKTLSSSTLREKLEVWHKR